MSSSLISTTFVLGIFALITGGEDLVDAREDLGRTFPFVLAEEREEEKVGEEELLVDGVLMFSLFAEEVEEREEELEVEVEELAEEEVEEIEGVEEGLGTSNSSSLVTSALFLFLFTFVIFCGSSSFSESEIIYKY